MTLAAPVLKAYTMGITKEDFVAELTRHQKADDFMRGGYWNGQKGCAVGCSLESVSKLKGITVKHNDHKSYETHLGIPEWLAFTEDSIFEGMSEERSRAWPVAFAKAIKSGADLEKAKTPYLIMLLEHTLVSMSEVKYDEEKFPDVAAAIKGSEAAVKTMIEAHKSGGDLQAAESAWSAARSAAESAWSAAWSAARSAAESAWSAAWSAARSAAESARSAAWSAAESAAWSAAGSAAESAAGSAAYDYYADRLIEILKDCK